MKIKLKALGLIRDLINSESIELDINSNSISVSNLLKLVYLRYPALKDFMNEIFIMKNGQIASLKDNVSLSDELAIIPMASGG